MVLTEDSVKLLVAEMRRLGDKIDPRRPAIERHDVVPVTSYGVPVFREEFVVDDEDDTEPIFNDDVVFNVDPVLNNELVFDTDPVFDEEFDAGPRFDEELGGLTTVGCDLVILNDEPDGFTTGCVGVIFSDQGPLFDAEPIYDMPVFDEFVADEELVIAAEPIFDEEVDAGPIFDEEPDYLATAACGVVLHRSLGITIGMAAHATTTSPRETSMTPSIDKKLILISDVPTVVPTVGVVAPSSINVNALTACSTECQDNPCDGMAPAEVRVIAREAVPVTDHAVATPTTMAVVRSNIKANAPTSSSTKCLSCIISSVAPTVVCAITEEVIADSSRADAVPQPHHTTLLCHEADSLDMFDIGVQAPTIAVSSTHNITSLESVHCDLVVLWKLPVSVDWQPWPPPTQVKITNFSCDVRQVPCPSFVMSYGGSASLDFCWIWKPPWSFHHLLMIRCAAVMIRKILKCISVSSDVFVLSSDVFVLQRTSWLLGLLEGAELMLVTRQGIEQRCNFSKVNLGGTMSDNAMWMGSRVVQAPFQNLIELFRVVLAIGIIQSLVEPELLENGVMLSQSTELATPVFLELKPPQPPSDLLPVKGASVDGADICRWLKFKSNREIVSGYMLSLPQGQRRDKYYIQLLCKLQCSKYRLETVYYLTALLEIVSDKATIYVSHLLPSVAKLWKVFHCRIVTLLHPKMISLEYKVINWSVNDILECLLTLFEDEQNRSTFIELDINCLMVWDPGGVKYISWKLTKLVDSHSICHLCELFLFKQSGGV